MHLEAIHVYKQFQTRQGSLMALKDINMHIETGEFVGAVGTSGSGKSTLLRLIAGLETPTTGKIKVDGAEVIGPGADRGVVFQNYTLYPWMTAMDNVGFGLKLQGIKPKERRVRVKEYLEVVGLSQFTNAYPKELSGGMKQRVAIARALACHPKVLLMDEPFGALDIQTKASMQEFILELWQRLGITIFMITHDVEEAVFLSQRVYVMTPRPGQIQRELSINLPLNRDHSIKRHSTFQDYKDIIVDLLSGRNVATSNSD
ncbi:MAG: ABC transporter ATP-binding protein [Prochloron sp. SP5CPC1]|nr:ABC transporter ATP-binding protein [Candidatus Paraprochloron terpiosi SP5CPC1]